MVYKLIAFVGFFKSSHLSFWLLFVRRINMLCVVCVSLNFVAKPGYQKVRIGPGILLGFVLKTMTSVHTVEWH